MNMGSFTVEKLYALTDFLTNGYQANFLDLLGVIALFFAVSVIVVKNPIGSLICLIGLFGTISVYLILIGLNFIGFSYLIVYIGAVSILFLFILMLINVRKSELLSNNVNSIPLALLIVLLVNSSWIHISPEFGGVIESPEFANLLYNTSIGNLIHSLNYNSDIANIMFVSSNNWDGFLVEGSHITTVGMVLYSVFNMWLLLAGLILLLAMVGCISITL
jgi:NADH-ubiquinone oxidoreductase chain 6